MRSSQISSHSRHRGRPSDCSIPGRIHFHQRISLAPHVCSWHAWSSAFAERVAPPASFDSSSTFPLGAGSTEPFLHEVAQENLFSDPWANLFGCTFVKVILYSLAGTSSGAEYCRSCQTDHGPLICWSCFWMLWNWIPRKAKNQGTWTWSDRAPPMLWWCQFCSNLRSWAGHSW